MQIADVFRLCFPGRAPVSAPEKSHTHKNKKRNSKRHQRTCTLATVVSVVSVREFCDFFLKYVSLEPSGCAVGGPESAPQMPRTARTRRILAQSCDARARESTGEQLRAQQFDNEQLSQALFVFVKRRAAESAIEKSRRAEQREANDRKKESAKAEL